MHEPILYILMRTDLDSLNPGKAMAQACHAANQAVDFITKKGSDSDRANLTKWEMQAGSFGTTIVLDGGTEQNIRQKITSLQDGFMWANVVEDPEYPLRDGKVVHIIPHFLTCAWVFSPYGKCEELNDMKLHP